MKLVLAMLCAASAFAQPARVLIVTGDSDRPHHDWRETTAAIRALLDESGRFDVRVTEEPRALNTAALAGYDAIVINYNGPRWGAAAEQAVEQFVRSGKGLVAFHLASYGTFFGMEIREGKWYDTADAGWAEFARMIGLRWKAADIGHARRWAFQVDWQEREHPIAAGLPASWMANDELYHRFTLLPGARVLASAQSPKEIGGTGAREPLVWVNDYGKGRVFYTTLGHDAMAWYQPGMMETFARGVEWAATGAVTLAPRDRHHAPRGRVRVLAVTSGHSYPESFYAMLDSLEGVAWKHAPSHREAFGRALEDRYDVVLFHDMHETIDEPSRKRLQAFVEAGKGVVSLHHAIVNYTDWPWWWQEVIGGKYFTKAQDGHAASSYKEDLEFLVTPAKGKERHPVLRGVGPLWVYDELYKGMWHAPGIEVLMETAHPDNDRPVVYVGPHPKARVLYIQLGHSGHTMKHPGFRRLMRNALLWTGRQME